MKKFTFTLQTVREVRDDRQTAAMMALAERVRAHEAARAAAALASERQARAAAAIARATSVSASVLQQADRHRGAVRLDGDRADIAVSQAAFGVESARLDLVDARRALETVLRFEDRQREAHRVEVARTEERDLAEAIEARSARAAVATRRDARRRAAA